MDNEEEADSLSASLLQWVRSFDTAPSATNWQTLSDGLILWTILQDIDADYFAGELPEPSVTPTGDWTRKWQNLKHLEKQLSIYYRDICDGQDANAASVPDLKLVASEGQERELEKLIMVIIRASMASPESNQRMAQRLMGLGRERAMVIANELRGMEEDEGETETETGEEMEDGGIGEESSYEASEMEGGEESGETNGSREVSNGLYRDPLLEREEELLQAQATIEQLQANNARVQSQLHDLRQDKEKLQEAFDAYRDEIDSKGRKHTGDDAFKKLQRQAENDKDYIDDLESQLQGSRSSVEKYERQLEKLRSSSEESQKLRDDIQLLRAENEEQNQKIKANENLKRKIQTLQEAEKANATLRDDLKHANDRLEHLDRLKQAQKDLEKEIIEKGGLIRNQEYQISELTTTRKHALYDAEVLAKKLEAARERHDRDHDAITELTDKLQGLGTEDSVTAAASFDEKKDPDERQMPKVPEGDEEARHLAEKVALLQQQLEAADTRSKAFRQRNEELEEAARTAQSDSEAQAKAHEQLEAQETTIAALRKDLDAKQRQEHAKSAQSPGQQQQQQDLAALQRENRLMATAWFDLSGRLQRNDVSLGRRRQEPKSWIGKQRAMVGPGSGLQHQR